MATLHSAARCGHAGRECPFHADPEAQQAIGLEAVQGLDQLLTAQPAGETIGTNRVGALVRLITQALAG